MIGEVAGLTEEMYAGMIEGLKPSLQSAKGFIAHSGGPSPNGGWRVIEIWESEADGTAWFEGNVKPNLPDGIVPDRTFHEVHSAFGPS
jgi:hypothetical protein